MKAVRRILLTLLALVLLLAVIPFLIPSNSYRQAAEKAASQALGMPVTIGSLHFRVLPVPGLSIARLRLIDVPGGTPRVTVGSGRVAVAMAPLFHKHVELTGIAFKDIVLRVSTQAKGAGVHTVHIDKLTGGVRLSQDALDMPDWKALLYGGTVRMEARLVPLTGKASRLSATVKAADIRIQPLLHDAAGQDRIQGRFASDLRIAADAASQHALERSLTVDGPVRLTKGQLSGLEMQASAAALLLGGNIASGPVAFDKLDTQLKVRGRNVWLNDIVLDSSRLGAKGHVSIAADKHLGGEIETSGMKGLTGAKLMIAGTTDHPLVYPAASSLIGGVIGGSIAGPAGAAVGAKVGSTASDAVEGVGKALKGIFGK
jgi:uncharacterized protein involved in outer membrane biogenesis